MAGGLELYKDKPCQGHGKVVDDYSHDGFRCRHKPDGAGENRDCLSFIHGCLQIVQAFPVVGQG